MDLLTGLGIFASACVILWIEWERVIKPRIEQDEKDQ